MITRPKISNGVKREIRQRCGFGCVICGSPVFDYEHIYGWKSSGHDPSAMTLLCPTHHREKTVGRMPVSVVEEHNATPFNGMRSFAPGHPLFFAAGVHPTLALGNVRFVPGVEQSGSPPSVGVIVDDSVAFGVGISTQGAPTIEVDIRDLSNRPLLRIVGGEMRAATANWDVTFEGTRLRIRSGLRRLVMDLEIFAADAAIQVHSANFANQHVRMLVGKAASGGGVQFPDSGTSISSITLAGAGFTMGESSTNRKAMHRVMNVRRAYGTPPVDYWSSFAKTRDPRTRP